MRVLAFAALALVLLGIQHAQAATPTLWISAGGYSVHFEPGHNGHNPGLLAEVAWSERQSFIAGAFRNSQARRSHLLAATYTPAIAQPNPDLIVKAGLVFGVVDGYRLNNGRPTPLAGLHGEVGTDRVRVAATLFPPVSGVASGALFLTLKVRLP